MHHSFGNITLGSTDKVPTVFLPGWGFGGQVLGLIKPLPHWIFPKTMLDPNTLVQDLVDLLAEEEIDRIRIIPATRGGVNVKLTEFRIFQEGLSHTNRVTFRY